jgi:hypothetical protein
MSVLGTLPISEGEDLVRNIFSDNRITGDDVGYLRHKDRCECPPMLFTFEIHFLVVSEVYICMMARKKRLRSSSLIL